MSPTSQTNTQNIFDLRVVDKRSPIGEYLRSKSDVKPDPQTYELDLGPVKCKYKLGRSEKQPTRTAGLRNSVNTTFDLFKMLFFDIILFYFSIVLSNLPNWMIGVVFGTNPAVELVIILIFAVLGLSAIIKINRFVWGFDTSD